MTPSNERQRASNSVFGAACALMAAVGALPPVPMEITRGHVQDGR